MARIACVIVVLFVVIFSGVYAISSNRNLWSRASDQHAGIAPSSDSQLVTPSPLKSPIDAAQASALQEAWAKYLDLPIEYANSIGMRFRLIPPGEYEVGYDATKIETLLNKMPADEVEEWIVGSMKDRSPSQRIRISDPYYFGKHEVTRGRFQQFVETTGYHTVNEENGLGGSHYDLSLHEFVRSPTAIWSKSQASNADDHPVVFLSRNDMEAFCRWLSEKEGLDYAIASDFQWECAHRAGTTSIWFGGDDPSDIHRICPR
jgi:formylglycine-generating enzyme required for sulfatase activity